MKVEYTSPSSVIISLSFIILFSRITIKSKQMQKIISFLSPLTYGVYLIHSHKLVFKNIIKKKYSFISKYKICILILVEMFESLKIYLICSFIDYIRLLLFNIFKIRKISILICNLIGKIGDGIIYIFKIIYNNSNNDNFQIYF